MFEFSYSLIGAVRHRNHVLVWKESSSSWGGRTKDKYVDTDMFIFMFYVYI